MNRAGDLDVTERRAAERHAMGLPEPRMAEAAAASRLQAVIGRAESRAAEADDLVAAAAEAGTLNDLDAQRIRRQLYDLASHLERIADSMRP